MLVYSKEPVNPDVSKQILA